MRLHLFRTHFFFLWKPSPSKGHRKRARLDKKTYLKQKPHPCQVGGDNGRLNFTSGGLQETTAWVYTNVSQRLFVVCRIPSQVWVTLLVAPTISSSGIHAGFGAIWPMVSFRFLVYICHHACWEESSKIHQIHLCAGTFSCELGGTPNPR